MATTTSLQNLSWTGNPADLKLFLRMVKLSVNALGINGHRVFNGERADIGNYTMVYCRLVHTQQKQQAR